MQKKFLTTPKKPPLCCTSDCIHQDNQQGSSSPHITTMTNIENDNNSSTGVRLSHNETPNEMTNTHESKSEQFYIANSCSLKALAVLCEASMNVALHDVIVKEVEATDEEINGNL